MKTTMKTTMIACTVLSLIAATVYVLVGTNVVSIPKLGVDEAPVAIFFIVAGCYLIGGLLILRGRRWLWMVGLAANTLVIAIFFLAYYQEPEMMLSTAGLATKIAQVLLEGGLIYLVCARSSRPGQAALSGLSGPARGLAAQKAVAQEPVAASGRQ